MTRQRTRHELANLDWLIDREHAQTVPCRDCGQPAGHTCINLRTGQPLDRLPAHSTRIHDADLEVQ